MELKEFELNDFDSIYNLFISEFGEKVTKADSLNKLNNILNKSDDYKIYVVKENEEVIGASVIYIHSDPFDNEDFATLWYYAVKSNYRGKGVGTFMLNELSKILKSNKIRSIRFTTANENIGCQKSAEKANFIKQLSYKKVL